MPTGTFSPLLLLNSDSNYIFINALETYRTILGAKLLR